MNTRRLALLLLLPALTAAAPPPVAWWPAGVDAALARAGANRPALLDALARTPRAGRAGMAFLVANMPPRDLRSLPADFLLEEVALAYQAWASAPWAKRVPEAVFLDAVLPYASLDEARDPWRKELREIARPIVAGCTDPGDAAQRLNAKLFSAVKVRYSTGRKRANQSPKESMASGLASCSGLSILLVDACRSVGVPARVVGTPLWANRSGNHTWVEVWDGERWRFTGAAEYDANGLDRGWFVGNARQARLPAHGVYAAAFGRTGLAFPMAWDASNKDIPAIDVTARYADGGGERAALEEEAKRYFEAAPEKRAGWAFSARLDAYVAKDEPAARQAVWKAYREAAGVHGETREDAAKHEVRSGKHASPYTLKTVGAKPDRGWPLVIALHGGGGVPKAVNDRQWKHMQVYYKDQPAAGGYKYVALRAPNDSWNGFYDGYVPPLIVALIRQLTLTEGVDPDKVSLVGYSHGGYGAFYIGPRIPDRFAAVHASAAAPPDGHQIGANLRNVRFSFMIGENDTAYGRADRCKAFGEAVAKRKAADPDYPVVMEWVKGHGHGGLPDRDKVKELTAARRDATPRRVTWELLDGVNDRMYWVGAPGPAGGSAVEAARDGNAFVVTTRKVKLVELYLDGRVARADRPLKVTLDGKRLDVKFAPSAATLCATMARWGDPQLACTCVVVLTPDAR